MTEIEKLAELLVKRLQHGGLNDQDEEILNAFRSESAQNEMLFQQLTDTDQVHELLIDYKKFKDLTWKKLLVLEPALRNLDETPVRSMSWRKYLVAASVLLILSAGMFFWFRPANKPAVVKVEDQSSRFKNDISPANQASILQLSDGRKIYIDSVANGNLAHQGNMKIIKKDGEVIYEFSKASSSSTPVYNTLITAKGDQQQLVLSDGSRVWMNAQSSIRFPAVFTGSERVVEVTGELFFEVAKNKSMPFIVRHGDVSVQVTGTKFNCNFYDGETTARTTLVEGSVIVKKDNDVITLSPGQQAEVDQAGSIKMVQSPEVKDAIAWVNGVFQFHHTSIETIMREAQRWYDVDVIFDGKINTGFNGKISRDVPVSKLLKVLELTGDVKFKIEGRTITVMP